MSFSRRGRGLLLALALVFSLAIVHAAPPAGFPITFTLPKAGFVTLVIEDAGGHRVRNLFAERACQTGTQTVAWDVSVKYCPPSSDSSFR